MKDREELLKADIEELKKELKETKMDGEKSDSKKNKPEQKKEKKEEKQKKPFEYKKFLPAALPFIVILCIVIGVLIGRNVHQGAQTNNNQNNNNNVETPTTPTPVQPVVPIINQCADSDGGFAPNTSGQVVYNDRIYSDYCLNNKTVEENYCSENNIVRTIAEPCVYCENNACVKFRVDKYGCMESDSKIDINNKGIVYDLNGVIGVDYCIANTVKEYYCDAFGYITYTTKVCVKCENGACTQNSAEDSIPKCVDTDGITYDRKGTVTDVEGNTATDVCQTGTTLQEFYCDAFGYVTSRFKRCENVCEEGRCVPLTT